jgi:hypothetical protein
VTLAFISFPFGLSASSLLDMEREESNFGVVSGFNSLTTLLMIGVNHIMENQLLYLVAQDGGVEGARISGFRHGLLSGRRSAGSKRC